MNYNDDSALSGFLGLIALGATAVIGYKSGHKKAVQQMTDQRRDEEILELKKQIETLKLEKK